MAKKVFLVGPESEDDDKILAQYGVKGMRWGVRKDRAVAAYRKRKEMSTVELYKNDPIVKTVAKVGKHMFTPTPEARANWAKAAAGLRERHAKKADAEAAEHSSASARLKAKVKKGKDTDMADAVNAERKSFKKAEGRLNEAAAAETNPSRAKTYREMAKVAREYGKGDFEGTVDYSSGGQAKRKAKRGVEVLDSAANIAKAEAAWWRKKTASQGVEPEPGDILHVHGVNYHAYYNGDVGDFDEWVDSGLKKSLTK